MNHAAEVNPSELIRQSKSGDRTSLGNLVEKYRPYLKLMARLQQTDRLRAKMDDSDLVQEASAMAIRDFDGFRGSTEAEFASWLRSVMAHVAANAVRHYSRKHRDVGLERQYQAELDRTSCLLSNQWLARDASPSEKVIQRERAVLVAEALERLPDDYRDIIIMRDLQGRELKEIAKELNRSTDACSKLWARAIVKVRHILEGQI